MSHVVSVFLTGRLCVVGPDATIIDSDLSGNQARVALALLVHERGPVHRDRLADIIWDGALPATWNTSLNAIVSKLRRQLGRAGLDGRSVLTSTAGSYAISLPANSWVDTEDAIRRVDRAERAVRHGDLASALQEATVASSILRRPFLGGLEGAWVSEVRRELSATLYRSYVVLAAGWIAQGHHQLGSAVAERAIELDPIRETAYRLVMEAELGRGDSIAALHAFDRCERVVREEFGATPSSATVAIADRVRQR